MKSFFVYPFMLAIGILPASAFTVQSPVAGTQVTSPFTLSASASVCGSKRAVAMGYSIDHTRTVIEPTSFSVSIAASEGPHTVSVKCWGEKAHEDQTVNFTVVGGEPPPSVTAAPSFIPTPGAYSSAQSVTLSSATAGAVIYYTTDGTVPSTSSNVYAAGIPVAASEVIQAIAVAPNEGASSLASGSYSITAASGGPVVPPNAIVETGIQLLPNWKHNHDPATPGNSVGTMSLVSDPSLSGTTAEFAASYTDGGGEIYSRSYGNDAEATNFLYDGYVWIQAGSQIANLEMDNNQVMANGDTVIYAFQCAGDSKTWDYSANIGTRTSPRVHWIHSAQSCNPATWTTNTWHHVQISYSRDDQGTVTYNGVWFDGVESPINATVPGAFALGWARGDLMTNFQIDGDPHANGSTVLYLDNLTISRW